MSEVIDHDANLGEPRTGVGSHSMCVRGSILGKMPTVLAVCVLVATDTLYLYHF